MKACCGKQPSHYLVNTNNDVLLVCDEHYTEPYCHSAIKSDFDLDKECYV